MHITLIAGARPNFMKVAPLIKAIKQAEAAGTDVHYRLVHTGQHYDKNMSETFFEELGIPAPDVNLGCGGGTQAEQTAHIMVAFEKDLMAHPTDVVLVVGDVTSTMACSIVAKKLNTKVCHVEAGIRSWDLTMPEEINRMVTDSLADYMFTTSDVANANLVRMGCEMNKNVWFVGNVMIDTLLANRARFRKPQIWDELGLKEKEYIVMTMHRPANVDEESHLKAMMEQIITNVRGLPIIFPIHPRTAKIFYNLWGDEAQLAKRFPNLHIVEPMGYLEFNYLVERAKAVVTDSGGITEETTVMGVPCITLRDNTERPETCTVGTNELIGTDPAAIKPALDKLFAGEWKKGTNTLFLPRYETDKEYAKGIANVYMPAEAVNGLDACFYADAILTGAGTMAREAACMGVPSVSFFAGSRLLAVDQSLVEAGKMYFSRSVPEIMRYLEGAKSGEASMVQSLATQAEIFGKLDEFIFGK